MTSSTRISIDPRLRARRVAVLRSQGRRRLRRLVALVVVALVVVLAIWTTRSPLLDVDHVRIEGAVRSGEGAVAEASGIEIGVPMTNVDLGAARASIGELPWIESVSIRRRWPGTISIEVVERVAVATYRSVAGGATVLDAEGRVLAVNAAVPSGLPRLALPAASPDPGSVVPGLGDVLAVAGALTADVAAWVEQLGPADDDVEVALVGGAIALVAGDEPAAELTALATVLDRVDLTCLTRIDLRVPGSPAVTRDQGCLAAAEALSDGDGAKGSA